MGLFDTIRRAVGGDSSSTDGDEQAAGDSRASDDGPELLDTAELDPATFREFAEDVVEGADPLTFDPDALARLDTAIEESYDGKTVGDDADATTYTENTVRFGSYLGELLVRAYDGEWVQSDGRWGVAVAGPDDEVGVAVFDVAARSFGGEPVFAAVVARLESELALDTAQEGDDDERAGPDTETDADSAVSEPTRVIRRVDDGQADEPADAAEPTATDERDEMAAADTVDSESSQAVETEPTRVVSRVEPESDGDDRPEDTAPTPVVSRVAEDEGASDDAVDAESDKDAGPGAVGSDTDDIEPSGAEIAGEESTVDSDDAETAEQSPDAAAGEELPGAVPAAETAADFSDDDPAVDVADAADETAETATADDGASEADEPERATADPAAEAPAPETPAEESADGFHGEDRAIDATPGEAPTDTADDGAAEECTEDASTLDSSSDGSSAAAPDSEPTPETDVADPADAARAADATEPDNAPAAVDTTEAESDAGEPSDGGSVASSPTDDSAMTDTSEQAAPPDTADETAATAVADDSEQPAPTDGDADSAAGSEPNWEPGTTRAEHAETAVEFADFWGEHGLDFSPASLSRLDDLVDAEWDDERFAETTFGSDDSFDDRAFTSVVQELGGYFGEVLVRQLGGEWTDETDHEAAVIVGGPAGQFAVPVFDVAITSLRKQAVFGRSYDALLEDLGRNGPTR
ncbi:hypothetical protein Harman_15880 [Haloarcula mannanilytica]|uniref:Uncharacterized protein n=1 Tax=Haloarcula mannanilytica TaxID=2509225 RepID=A0A4C2EM00_9EURY|nr:hypothetical protein [Haloarcula mannanilytica]GCF13653.1 hypothetical protein Harman_15880 [Haloarcula mannanilytica]